ncbi:MAG TPA: DUF3137 domain-containing protein [Candidatus Baltobacteraceae bacterium]|nr:DUF3137 domain-containing protein [Candidatus Baltobacteraceae bacterium]
MKELKEEDIRKAYEEVRFDERTPDESGFAARFEDEFKPLLIDGIGFNLDVEAARRRRKKIALIMAAVVAVGFFPVAILLNTLETQRAIEVFIVAVVVLGVGGLSYATTKRADEEDPNHAAVVEAVLERFECRIGMGSDAYAPVRSGTPVFPPFDEIKFLDEYVVGRFDDRIDFAAVRAKAWSKEGKRMRLTFRGWHLVIDLPFAFSGTTVVWERKAEHMLRKVDGMLGVELESADFASRFDVHATDQVEARMILTPDVMQHLLAEADRLDAERMDAFDGGLMLGFQGDRAYIWMPSWDTALAVWRPLDPPALIDGLHGAFAELAAMRAFLRDIDVIAESEGFRALAARNARAS